MSAEHEGPPDFSELSALMKQFHQGSFKAARDWSEALRQLVERARQHDEERFDEVWAPHLKQYFSQDHPALPMNFETEQEDEIFDRIR